jgi:hypothetical protein
MGAEGEKAPPPPAHPLSTQPTGPHPGPVPARESVLVPRRQAGGGGRGAVSSVLCTSCGGERVGARPLGTAGLAASRARTGAGKRVLPRPFLFGLSVFGRGGFWHGYAQASLGRGTRPSGQMSSWSVCCCSGPSRGGGTLPVFGPVGPRGGAAVRSPLGGVEGKEGHLVDALAPRGDEGRGTLRQAPGSRERASIRGSPNGATHPRLRGYRRPNR